MRIATLALLALAGCVSPEPGPWASERAFPRKAEEVGAAAVTALHELDLMIDTHELDSRGGRVEARRADGDRLRIEVRNVAPERTLVSVYTTAGSEGLAELIFERIDARLGTRSRSPARPAP